MRTLLFQSLAVATAVLTCGASALAQENASPILNTLELRQLVKRAEPADNARLAAHFTALAERYAAEAKRHLSMSKNAVGHPSRNLATGLSAHCNRLADINTQSEKTTRELAAYHDKMAGGIPSSPPPGAARFLEGAGAPEPTKTDLNRLAATATTATDHHALEEYFQTLAKRYTADAKEHATLAQTYRGTRIAQAAVHHDHLARLSREAAKEAEAAAAMHKGLAGAPR
jgi:hypothetical protein